MNIIFLDVDGVLNSKPYFESIKVVGGLSVSDYHLQQLAKIYHTCNAKIVLSSSWRCLNDPSDIHVYRMYQYLLDELARYDMEIMDHTPNLKSNRPLEIKTWLDSREDKEQINFVSLDDDFPAEEYAAYGIESCLVQTKFFCKTEEEGGLQLRHVEQAIKILTGINKEDE